MDPLTDLLTAIRVESVCHGRLDASAPWGLRFQSAPYAKFCYVSRGDCWLQVKGLDQAIWLQPGDFILLAPDLELCLRHDLNSLVTDFDNVLRERLRTSLQIGGGGDPATLILGKFQFSQSFTRPLTDAIPPVIHLRAQQTRTLALKTTLELLVVEATASEPTSQLIINRLADVLFIQAIRAYMESASPDQTVWLNALADPQIGASLRHMHSAMERSWTVADLAAATGMSRSGYAQRFKQLVGESPLEYLTRWRIYRACRLLQETDSKIVDVAIAVGYDSDGAFHRAFKRVVGYAPGEYRRNGPAAMVGIAGDLAKVAIPLGGTGPDGPVGAHLTPQRFRARAGN